MSKCDSNVQSMQRCMHRPPLATLTGEQLTLKSANSSDEAWLDVSARGVWSREQRAFLDIRSVVFDPLARKYNGQTMKQSYRTNEMEKKCSYNECILNVEMFDIF